MSPQATLDGQVAVVTGRRPRRRRAAGPQAVGARRQGRAGRPGARGAEAGLGAAARRERPLARRRHRPRGHGAGRQGGRGTLRQGRHRRRQRRGGHRRPLRRLRPRGLAAGHRGQPARLRGHRTGVPAAADARAAATSSRSPRSPRSPRRPLMTAYCASKSGVEAFAHCLRAEVGHQGVKVGVGYLSWTDTDMVRGADAGRRHAGAARAAALAVEPHLPAGPPVGPARRGDRAPLRARLRPVVAARDAARARLPAVAHRSSGSARCAASSRGFGRSPGAWSARAARPTRPSGAHGVRGSGGVCRPLNPGLSAVLSTVGRVAGVRRGLRGVLSRE